jgi:hypothetical protein
MKNNVELNMDIRLIAQQLEHNVLDTHALIGYIANLLKANCAPARDGLVHGMEEECKKGNFPETLKICFELLEVMKLVRSIIRH